MFPVREQDPHPEQHLSLTIRSIPLVNQEHTSFQSHFFTKVPALLYLVDQLLHRKLLHQVQQRCIRLFRILIVDVDLITDTPHKNSLWRYVWGIHGPRPIFDPPYIGRHDSSVALDFDVCRELDDAVSVGYSVGQCTKEDESVGIGRASGIQLGEHFGGETRRDRDTV